MKPWCCDNLDLNGFCLQHERNVSECTNKQLIKENNMRLIDYAQGLQIQAMQKWEHYFDIYEKCLRPYRDRPIRLLEIGNWMGGSLEMWQWYFKEGSAFVGIDINPHCKELQDDYTTIYTGDSGDKKMLSNIMMVEKPFDIIIDDGSHFCHDQINAFEALWGHVLPGGLYIVEDLHSNKFEKFRKGSPTFIQDVHDIVNDKYYDCYMENDKGQMCVDTTRPFSDVDALHMYDSMVVLEKAAVNKKHPKARLFANSMKMKFIEQPKENA